MHNKAKPAIKIEHLSKKYKGNSTFALNNLSLYVNPGEVYGFLGPNGAGKSTTIRLLMNYIQPTSGAATILGNDIVRSNTIIRSAIGYMSGEVALYSKMNGRQFLAYMNDLQPVKNKPYINALTKRFKADLSKKIGDLSRGNRQKIGLIQAFMHEPSVLLLDEPTSGLDPLMQEEFYSLIKETKARGAAIFVCSHILSEVQKICDRIGIIREGKLIVEQDIARLTQKIAQTYKFTFSDKVPKNELQKIKGVKITSITANTATVNIHGKLAPLLNELANHDVEKIESIYLDLENIFMHFYKEGVKK